MEKTIWLSFDLGVGGDYEHLYAWLDSKKAVECGDSVACFHYEVGTLKEDNEIIKKIKTDLVDNIDVTKRTRIYCIRRVNNGKITGSFIFGSRKGNPWDGYGSNPTNDDLSE